VYHCPADNYIDANAGHKVHVRSYSMNSAVGTVFNSSSTYNAGGPPIGSAVQGGWLMGSGYSTTAVPWRTYGKSSSFGAPGPANTWVIMDENPFSINDGSFAIAAAASAGATYLIDFPGGNHSRSAGMAFADGHSIVHKWMDSRTYTPQGILLPGQGSTKSTTQSPDNQDCFYLASITSAPK
jgi:prepilin-type processing-associated H-X9-DG protein